jgi:hypothetical protein
LGEEMAYRTVYKPDHPRADVTGFVSLHILIAEEKLGRPLQDGEVVHHCDFNRGNNDPSNLLITDRIIHQNLPALQSRFLHQKGLYTEFLEFVVAEKDYILLLMKAENLLVQAEARSDRTMARIKRKEAKEIKE